MRWIVFASLLLALAACGPDGGSAADSPEGAVRTFLEAVDDNDCEAVRDLAMTPSDVECETIEGMHELLAGTSPSDAKITLESRTGPSAVVQVQWEGDDEPSSIETQQVDGEWKVILDSAV